MKTEKGVLLFLEKKKLEKVVQQKDYKLLTYYTWI